MIYTATNGIKVDVCNCGCHKYGICMDHIEACCDVCGDKYIETDGSVNQVSLTNLIETKAKALLAYKNRVVKAVTHPATGEPLTKLHEWQTKFAIDDKRVTMHIFEFDQGKNVYVNAADYELVKAADRADFNKGK
jgi:hypothetical protein